MVLPKNAADKLDGENDKQEHTHWMNFKQDGNSWPKLSKIVFFGHAWRNNWCNLVKACILGMMPGKRRRGGAP